MKRQRDVDSADQASRILIATWSAAGGAIGAFAGIFAARTGSAPAWITVPAGVVAGIGLVFLFSSIVAGGAGRAMATIFSPSGRSTRGESGLSLAESLVARGRYREAADEYRREAGQAPGHAEPLLRLARLCRDRLDDPVQAAEWFKRARAAATDPEQQALAIRELTELFERRLGTPARALPELARFLELHPDSRSADWARREMTRLRAVIRSEASGDEPQQR